MALSNTASTEDGRMRIRMLNVTSGAQQADFIFSLCNNASTQVDSIAIGRTAIYPATDAAIALGIAASNRWNGLNLATTTALNWNNGNATITHSAGQLAFATGGTEAFRLDSAQRMIFGGVASLNIFSINASLQVNGNLADTSAASIARFSTPIGGPNLTFAKSHNAVVGTNTIVQVNEELGNINFVGANGTTYDAAARIQALVDGTPGAANDMPGRLVFFTTPDGSATLTEAMRIDNAQRLLIGQTGGTITVAAGGTNPLAQVAGTTAAAAWSAARFSADANPSRLFLSKSRNAAIGSHTIVQSGDSVGELLFAGSNGTQFDNVASVAAVIDGTPGAANDMPGRLVFSTVPDGSSTLTERLRITQDGVLVTGGTAAQFSNLNVELHGITAAKGVMTHCLWEASANGIIWQMRKSRGASIGSFTIVQNNDTLGILNAFGADGTQYIQAAQIIFSVDGTPGTNDMPGRIAFLTTPDGASAPTEKLRITNDGRVQAFSTTGLTGGGNTSMAYQLSSTLIGVYAGSGPPTITAPKGSLYLRSDGTTTNDRAYINTNGATTWTAITTVA
jgi:hypothetical protein